MNGMVSLITCQACGDGGPTDTEPDTKFTWSSSDEAVAVVNVSRLVTARENGQATITATIGRGFWYGAGTPTQEATHS